MKKSLGNSAVIAALVVIVSACGNSAPTGKAQVTKALGDASLGLRLSKDEVKDMIRELDVSGDGVVSIEEMVSFLALSSADFDNIIDKLRGQCRKFERSGYSMKDTFAKYDLDNDGIVEPDDFKKVLKRMDIRVTEDEMAQLMVKLDHDGDGEDRKTDGEDEEPEAKTGAGCAELSQGDLVERTSGALW